MIKRASWTLALERFRSRIMPVLGSAWSWTAQVMGPLWL